MSKKSKRLGRVVFPFGNTHPEDIDRDAEFLELEFSSRVRDGMTTIRTNDQVSSHFARAVRGLHADADNLFIFKKQIDDFMLHGQSKGGEVLCAAGEKVEKIPLRHESDKFAARRQTREIGDGNCMTIKYSAYLA